MDVIARQAVGEGVTPHTANRFPLFPTNPWLPHVIPPTFMPLSAEAPKTASFLFAIKTVIF
jgi:hypothetical protein